MFRKILFSLVIILMIAAPVQANGGSFPAAAQTGDMLLNEMETVYQTNLARRAEGLSPLRMNGELNEAGRWFSWDSTVNRDPGYCGHQDTNGNWPDTRAVMAGYTGSAGAENAYCGYVTPSQAVDGWLNSDGHRANLLSPDMREIGLGYYQRTTDQRGYVTQDFGFDALYPPVVIDNEAPTTSDRNVNLYIYNAEGGSGWGAPTGTQQMKISNNACFLDADWQAYDTETSWTLDDVPGWRDVYVKSTDALNRTFTVSDSIYLGSGTITSNVSPRAFSQADPNVTLYQLNGGGRPYMQFSLGWVADNSFATFQKWWGNGAQITDSTAQGGGAYKMTPGAGETFAWVYSSEFYANTNFVGYFRLKTSSNASSAEVARITVKSGDYEYPAISIKGTDFTSANAYQEFAFPFTSPANDEFLFFEVWRSGSADITFDAVTIFTPSIPVQPSYTWNVPGGNYRGQGVWVRYTNNAKNFTYFSEASTVPMTIQADTAQRNFLATPTDGSFTVRIPATLLCAQMNVLDNASWISSTYENGYALLTINPHGMALGEYQASITLQPVAPEIPALTIPIHLTVVPTLNRVSLPLIAH